MAGDAVKMYISCIKHSRINEVTDSEFDTIDRYLANNPLRSRSLASDVVISGYYGFGNSGDDSILYAIIRELKTIDPSLRIVTLSKTPSVTSEMYGVESDNRFKLLSVALSQCSKTLMKSGWEIHNQ